MDHRVEPPSWLPQGATPQAAGPEADEAPASDDAPAPQHESASADGAAEESSNGNGHDGSYTYSYDSYSYTQESPHEARGPLDEAGNPPFHELPGAGFDQSPAPPPPGDELAGSGFVSSAASVGLAYSDRGYSGADAGRADGEHGDGGYGDGGFGSSGLGSTGAGAGRADAGFTGGAGGIAGPDTGPTGGEGYTPHYAPEYPSSSAPTAMTGPEAAGQDTQRLGSTTYAYTPPPPVTPPPPPQARGRKSAAQARRANLIVARLEPWSVMKFSFLISLVAWVVLFVAVALLYYALSSLGVFASLQKTLASVTSSQGSAGVDLSKWTSGTRILGYTMLIGAIDVVLITALSTLGAVVYNLVTHLGGGIEITLKETE